MADKKSFVFYHEWGAVLQKLPPEDAIGVVFALIEYSENGTVPQLSPIADIVFTAFKPSMDRGIESWEKTCKRNSENIKKRWGNNDDTKNTTGKSGISKNTKNTDSDSDSDSDSDYNIIPPNGGQSADKIQNQGESLTVLKTAGGNTRHSTTLDEDFNAFWEAYPKKADKQKALKAWQKLKPDKEMLNAMLAAIERHKQSDKQWHRDDGQYIPYPASWLNGRRWEDEDGVDLTAESPKDKPSYDLDKILKHAKDSILKIDADGHTYTVPRNETE